MEENNSNLKKALLLLKNAVLVALSFFTAVPGAITLFRAGESFFGITAAVTGVALLIEAVRDIKNAR